MDYPNGMQPVCYGDAMVQLRERMNELDASRSLLAAANAEIAKLKIDAEMLDRETRRRIDHLERTSKTLSEEGKLEHFHRQQECYWVREMMGLEWPTSNTLPPSPASSAGGEGER